MENNGTEAGGGMVVVAESAIFDPPSPILNARSSMLNARSALLPLPAGVVTTRPGVLSDVPFMDRLQRMHSKAVGFMPTAQFEGHIKSGKVLIAEDGGVSVGYCLAADRYFKHDDVGIVYQMNVEPGRQRGLVGASLLKARFERSAYGCKLYCCWCAQDLAANKFWEAMGFVPLAFRTGGTGSGKKPARMHIFWQKRIREGDESTPWWFPSETSGGAIKENRLVLPIPPGTHWSEVSTIVLPGVNDECGMMNDECKKLPGKRARVVKVKAVVVKKAAIALGGLRFGALPVELAGPGEKFKKEPKPKVRNDPTLVAAARELRDRWLEQVNETPLLGGGKYEVSRRIEEDGERLRTSAFNHRIAA